MSEEYYHDGHELAMDLPDFNPDPTKQIEHPPFRLLDPEEHFERFGYDDVDCEDRHAGRPFLASYGVLGEINLSSPSPDGHEDELHELIVPLVCHEYLHHVISDLETRDVSRQLDDYLKSKNTTDLLSLLYGPHPTYDEMFEEAYGDD